MGPCAISCGPTPRILMVGDCPLVARVRFYSHTVSSFTTHVLFHQYAHVLVCAAFSTTSPADTRSIYFACSWLLRTQRLGHCSLVAFPRRLPLWG